MLNVDWGLGAGVALCRSGLHGWQGFEEKVLTAKLASQARHDFGAPQETIASRFVVADDAELETRADRKIVLRVVFLAYSGCEKATGHHAAEWSRCGRCGYGVDRVPGTGAEI